MTTRRHISELWRERLLTVWCRQRGHDWAGARDHEAQADGLLLCMRCGFEQTSLPLDATQPMARVR